MSPALVISRREIRTYFNSPVAYIVVTVFAIITGYLFFTQLFLEKQADLRGFFGIMPLLFMFLAPAITMRLLADEKAPARWSCSSPCRSATGRWCSGSSWRPWRCSARRSRLTLVFAITVRSLGPLDRGPAIGGYLGLVLMGGAYVAIGVMCSAFTRNSIVAFIVVVRDLVRALPARARHPVRAAVAAGARQLPQHRRPLREHQPRRHRYAATSSTTSR